VETYINKNIDNTEPTFNGNIKRGVETEVNGQIAQRPVDIEQSLSTSLEPSLIQLNEALDKWAKIQSDLYGDMQTVAEMSTAINSLNNFSRIQLQVIYNICYELRFTMFKTRLGSLAMIKRLNLSMCTRKFRLYLDSRGVKMSGLDNAYVDKNRSSKISSGLIAHFATFTPEKRAAYNEMTGEAVRNSPNKAEGDRKAAEASRNYWDNITPEEQECKNENMRNWHANLSDEEYEEWITKLLSHSRRGRLGSKGLVQIGNKEIWFDSGWELSLYTLLVKFGVSFMYTNDNGKIYRLEKRSGRWHPDFELSNGDIIEVKAPYLVPKFKEDKLPRILKCPDLIGRKIYLLTWNIGKHMDKYDSLDILLKDLELIVT